MSKVVHAKPVWGWSLVLLSTLLLAPGASTSAALHAALLLAAQAQTAPAPPLARVPATPAPTPGPAAEKVAAPRRADDEWAQRLRVQDSRSLTLLGLTGFAPSDTLAILVPARLVVLVPDEGDAPRRFAPSSAPRARAAAFDAATPPRAPPFVSPA